MTKLDDAIAAHLEPTKPSKRVRQRTYCEAETIPPAKDLPKQSEANALEQYRTQITAAVAARALDEQEQKRVKDLWHIEEQMPPKQFKINRLLADGLSPRQVAEELGIKIATVYRHRNDLYQTLQAAAYLAAVGAKRVERAAWLRQIVERSMDDQDDKWFNPRIALAGLKLMADISGDLTQQPDAIQTAPNGQVQVIINLGDYTPATKPEYEPIPYVEQAP